MAALGISVLCLNGFGQDKNPVSPKADSTVAVAKGKENNDNRAVTAAAYSNAYLFDESKLSPRQKEFLAKKRLIEFQYADSSESSRNERIARMKSDFFEKQH